MRTSKYFLVMIFIGIVVIGIGVIVFIISLQNEKLPSESVNTPSIPPSANSPILPKINIIYGKVIDTDATLTIEELLPPGKISGKTFVILTNNKTEIIRQAQVVNNINDHTNSSQQNGDIQDVRENNYVMLITSADPSTASSLTASKIIFSETNPFKENSQENIENKEAVPKGSEDQYLKKLPNKESSILKSGDIKE